jgi:HEAT repeat protein
LGLGADSKDAIPTLIQVLEDEDSDVSSYALQTLGQIGEAELTEVISNQKDATVREKMENALAVLRRNQKK